MKLKLTFWKLVFFLIMSLGIYSAYIRYAHGLGAVSNMTDQFPWGIWIGFDVLCGVMLAAGGFIVTGAVHLLNIKRLHSIARPTVLTAFLGYCLVIVGLCFDLGRPWFIWHQLIYMNPHSVMFEVGFCVMFYTTVLFFEFLPNVLERFNLRNTTQMDRADHGSTGRRRHPALDAAPEFPGRTLPHHAQQVASILVFTRPAVLFLRFRVGRGLSNDHFRIIAQFAGLWAPA